MGKGTPGNVYRLLSGLAMIFVLLSAVRSYQGFIRYDIPSSFYEDGRDIAADAKEEVDSTISDIIINQTCAYIMDEAESLNTDIQIVDLELDPQTRAPKSIHLAGRISPYDKSMLADFLETTLGIKKEAQTWN